MLLDHLDRAHPVLIEATSGRVFTVGDIRERAGRITELPRGLAFLLADQSVESAAWFLSLVEAHYPVALIDAGGDPPAIARLVEEYRPDLIVDSSGAYIGDPTAALDGRLVEESAWLASECGPQPHEDLAVLLTTSGSTGSPKFVRLSASNVRVNAGQIVAALGIHEQDRAVTLLPLSYSFGMSVLTSHALAGSSVLVTRSSVIEECFWSDLDTYGVSFLPGVPTTYSMLKRLGFESRELKTVRALIQAGGRLAPELVSHFHEVMDSRGGQFFVMYGQTEASPRISCLPPSRLPEKLGSVGPALSGGELTVRGHDGVAVEAGETGEVFYRGPNVMMGYAESREDLALGRTHGDVLATGDLGHLDDEGFLYLSGRSKRISKLAGARVSLDELEAMAAGSLSGDAQVAVVSVGDERITVFVAGVDGAAASELRLSLARHLRVPPKPIDVRVVDALPLLASGKPDYTALERLSGAGADGK